MINTYNTAVWLHEFIISNERVQLYDWAFNWLDRTYVPGKRNQTS